MSQFFWAPGMTLSKMEEEAAANALKFYDGNEQSAANSLGITVVELRTIFNRHHLSVEAEKTAQKDREKKSQEFLARSRGMVYNDPESGLAFAGKVSALENTVQPADGLDPAVAATRVVVPKSEVPAVAVLDTAGTPAGAPVSSNPALAAAKKTQILAQEHLPE